MMHARLLALLLISVALNARAGDGAESPFVWNVRGTQTSHCLVGSVHALPATDHTLPPDITACYARSQVVVFEAIGYLIVDEARYVRMLGELAESTPGGLEARVGEALYRRFREQAAALKLDPRRFSHFRPWYAAQMLSSFRFIDGRLRSDLGVERQLYRLSGRDHKRTIGLVDDDTHAAVFSGMSEDASIEYFASTLEDAERYDQRSNAVDLWRAGDAAGLEQQVLQMHAQYPALHQRLLAQRNRDWMPTIVRMLASDEPHMIVAGAAHFFGPDNVRSLLQQRGVEVTP